MLSKKELNIARSDLYSSLNNTVEELTGSRMTHKQVKRFFEDCIKFAFQKAAETGYLRLPGGLGVIKVVERNALTVNIPGSDVVHVPKRLKLKFDCGTYQKNISDLISKTM